MDALLSGITNGFAVFGGDVAMDIQQRSGQGRDARIYTVHNGKLGSPVRNATYTFNSTELCKNLLPLGDASTQLQRGLIRSKGQPDQVAMHSVQAVAARVRDVRIVPADRA
jgi:predicted Zn-dependent protease